jgi:hypothetical protein
MSRDNGFNPMRWDCAEQGCFNHKKRPKIELFADCLPGRIAFSDIDAIAEINGNLLLLEWKDHKNINTGQRVLFERVTQICPATVLIVQGDAEHMTVISVRTVWRGTIMPVEATDLDGLRGRIREWSQWAMRNSAVLQSQRNQEHPHLDRSPMQ